MKVKTAELIGPALDWAVAVCEGFTDYDSTTEKMLPPRREYGWVRLCDYNFSSDWSQGGPIIERERISFAYEPSLVYEDKHRWKAIGQMSDRSHEYGPTPLVAALRCHVAFKLGDEVEVPEELL